ncbi:MAG: PD40 domain-containing protein, partial [Acidobacteria bacterium]|nr:PD40 domain-containing protein [Acidobacteriota bacterium]
FIETLPRRGYRFIGKIEPEPPVEIPARLEFLESSKDENQASYSPDGKHVAFDTDRSGVWSVWIGDMDGSHLSEIWRELSGYPRWSPDFQRIAYQQSDGDEWGVYAADVNQRVGRKLKTATIHVGVPQSFDSHQDIMLAEPKR